ncbi:hypothetical protein Poli38472_012591 [Pythium oligandrum]|uniref:FYVE-type domain-containing protein n=1 Tax=Pythium oligandrum TaxID=41045 RepID=A0A8K1CEM0_PYTOL|nr:hypothetical protein Poli38472_012591 [Pythium oligandrum]|eukprot:TMW61400.1 hypothetical protein Poli38472_012591 [Pythium oligandrum]
MTREGIGKNIPALELSPAEERAVHDEAWALIHHTLEAEDAFNRGGGRIDPKVWKQVTENDSLRVYKHRRPRKGTSHAGSDYGRDTFHTDLITPPELLSLRAHDAVSKSSWRTSVSDAAVSTSSSEGSLIDDTLVPELLSVGYIEGDVNDLNHGAYDGDDLTWKVRSAYLRDKLADARFLARIETPTYDEPFRFLGIKWFTTEYPPVVGQFISQRDTLVIEAIGTSVDHHGFPYSYYLLHDFMHPSIPEVTAPDVVRIRFSFCWISRQVRPDRIGVYSRGRVDIGGDLMKSVGLTLAGISIASTANSVETSYNKKLVWLMEQEQEQRRLTQNRQIPGPVPACHSCRKQPSGLLSRGLINCQVCGHHFCSKCSVSKKLVVDVTAPELSLRSLPFCFGCVLKAKQLSAVEVARATIIKNPK